MLLNPDHYRQSISSKFIPATETKPQRIKTTTGSNLSKIVSYYNGEEYPQNHVKALVDHATELDWLTKNDYAIGSTKDGYVLVLIPKQND